MMMMIIRSGCQAEIRWSVSILKSHRRFYVSFSRRATGLCMCHLLVWSNYNFLYSSQRIILPTQACLILYSFCSNLLHSLIMWLMVSSLSPHNLHLLFCCVLSILALIWLVLIALFYAAIRRNSVSLLRFPYLSRVHVFSCEMFISRLKSPLSHFFPHFCFLVIVVLLSLELSVLFLAAAISLFPRFSM